MYGKYWHLIGPLVWVIVWLGTGQSLWENGTKICAVTSTNICCDAIEMEMWQSWLPMSQHSETCHSSVKDAVTKHWLSHITKFVTTSSFNYLFTAKTMTFSRASHFCTNSFACSLSTILCGFHFSATSSTRDFEKCVISINSIIRYPWLFYLQLPHFWWEKSSRLLIFFLDILLRLARNKEKIRDF